MYKFAVLISFVLMLAACRSKNQTPDEPQNISGPVRIAAICYPLQYFADRIGGNLVEVSLMVDRSNQSARPTSDDVQKWSQADLILLNGGESPGWLQTVSFPDRKTVDVTSTIRSDLISMAEGFTHRHGPQGPKLQEMTVLETWLDFQLCVKQALVIRDALIKIRPGQSDQFNKNHATFEKELIDLDQKMRKACGFLQGKTVVADGPQYSYLAHRYGFKIAIVKPPVKVDLSGGDFPREDLERWWQEQNKGSAFALFFTGLEAKDSFARLGKNLGLAIYRIRPGGSSIEESSTIADDPDWLAWMEGNIQALRAGY